MNYPDIIDNFITQKNSPSTGNIIINDEQITIPSITSTEVPLSHDNVIDGTVEVWTGVNKTGTQVIDFTVNPDVNKSWEFHLLFGTTGITFSGPAYVSYETSGDQLDADDINKLQDSIVSIQNTLGTNPEGIDGDVKTRLQSIEDNQIGISQIDKLNVTASAGLPLIVDIIIPSTVTFKRPQLEVLHFTAGATNQIITEFTFDNADSSDFETDDQLIFDGTMHLKILYQENMTDDGTLGSGFLQSSVIDKTAYKVIESLEVV